MTSNIRLFLDQPMEKGQVCSLDAEPAHYLHTVMRQRAGAQILLFNGRDGEFCAEISALTKRGGQLCVLEKTRPLHPLCDLWLLFAPIKKARTDFIVEKAAELGIGRICPISTELTNTRRVNLVRLKAHMVEAVEQCGGTALPRLEPFQSLDTWLKNWPAERALYFCDERLSGTSAKLDFAHGPAAILIGPEAGFSANERNRLHSFASTALISLGPRILRADTAAVAAIALWQSAAGDWDKTHIS